MIDTNVLVSGTLVSTGQPARIVDSVLDGRHTLVSTPQLVDEFTSVMQRPRIARKYPEAAARAHIIVEALLTLASQTEAPAVPGIVGDPDDAYLLGCAVLGRADVLVTGDIDLLRIGSYQGIAIVNPREFLERYDS